MKFNKSIDSIKKLSNNLSSWGLILIFCLLFLFLVVLFKSSKKENFETTTHFLYKTGNDIYDDFYVDIYDDLVYNDLKDNYEIQEIINKTTPTHTSTILDIGSGTGHHSGKLSEQGYNVLGIDKSQAMINKAKTNYPKTKFVQGDVLDANPNLENDKFTHILCLYFTIYYIENKEMFFENCMNWLKPGGFLIVHVVDRESFDPIIPAGQGFLIFSPQKYAKKRINTSKVVFNNFIYSSKFDLNPSEDKGSFDEKIEFKNNNSVRKHKHVMYMEDAPEVLAKAQNCGFIINDKIDLLNCGYDNQYLYVLLKPA
jgi:SAM-dependent methyltransferase